MAGRLVKYGWTIFVIVALFCGGRVFAAVSDKEPELFEMSIEQLMQVEVASTATLTETKLRIVPAAMTTITEEQILASGARSLFELLDIYVPNLQWWRGQWESDHMGLRGIISDRDDKYLILVNNRVMNERTHYGAMSERDLVMLRDIHHIDIVRGPGSALYGPGAVAMVINIITHNAETFQGTEITGRLGAIEEFYSGEVRHGRQFDDGSGGYFVYFGMAEYDGANEQDAPQIYGVDLPSNPADPMPQDGLKKGHPLHQWVPNDGEAARGIPPIKIYGQLNKGNWTFWGRYTRGGKQLMLPTGLIARAPYGWTDTWALPLDNGYYAYQQATGFIGYNKEFNEKTSLEASASYDMFDFERLVYTWWQEAIREDKYIGKAVIRHDIGKRHKIAVGAEILHGEYGYHSPGYPHREAIDGRLGNVPRWSANMYSVFGEHQWTVCDQVTTFLGARLDDHEYTNKMFSPRASLVYTPTRKDALKLMWARSVRANYEEEMKAGGVSDSSPEKLDSIEFRWERTHNENLDLAVSIFKHYNLELIGWSGTTNSQIVVGTMKNWGIEFEATYHTERTRLMISHSYTKLSDFVIEDAALAGHYVQFTAHPYGYGDDLQMWANHLTKIVLRHKLNERWTFDGSLRIYWGYPGLRDYAQYSAAGYGGDRTPFDIQWERSFRGSYFLNLGLQYKPNKNLTVRVDGYNLLGAFYEDLNHRNYGGEGSADFRCHAPSVGATVIWLLP